MALKIRPGLISVVFPFSILASMSKEPAHFLVIEASRKLGSVEISSTCNLCTSTGQFLQVPFVPASRQTIPIAGVPRGNPQVQQPSRGEYGVRIQYYSVPLQAAVKKALQQQTKSLQDHSLLCLLLRILLLLFSFMCQLLPPSPLSGFHIAQNAISRLQPSQPSLATNPLTEARIRYSVVIPTSSSSNHAG